jgi:selenocysteine lyase/cysteine desulfurase
MTTPAAEHSHHWIYPDHKRDLAFAAFSADYPAYAETGLLDELRAREYSRLDRLDQVYLDYTGGGLHADSQVRAHMELLGSQVFGNPHSHNPSSLASTALVEKARAYVLEFFNAHPGEYELIFTANASGALKLVGEAFPFGPGDRFVLTADNHNSVNGIREFARSKGAAISYVPLVTPEMRLDEQALTAALAQGRHGANNLFAYPAQSNFTGVQHSRHWIGYAQERGWRVLLDAAAYAPSSRLDLGSIRPDFVTLSFYKIFGYPTGVGGLLVRKEALRQLRRPWFAGGTISIASVQGDGHYFIDGGEAFEDGTINYLSLPAVEIGLRHIAGIGIETIHQRVQCLGGWLLQNLLALRHSNGRPMIQVYGPAGMECRGGNIAFNVFDCDGLLVSDRRVEELANAAGISLRTGCFCNPGAGEIAHRLTEQELRPVFAADKPMSFAELNTLIQQQGKQLSTVRISVGLASNFNDVYRFMQFAAGFRDRNGCDLGVPGIAVDDERHRVDTA